ncbi:MAG: hypothetical protein U5J99_00150 [Parvularculaceae bacterium]|nr:hypothetical protein [Parvularculaceae bacterium]
MSEYYLRLAAALTAAGALGFAVVNPSGGKDATARMASIAGKDVPLSERPCPAGEGALGAAFAPLDDILSISPLGGVTAPGETLPAPAIRLNTKKGQSLFERRQTTALAPAKADIIAIERRTARNEAGDATRESWSVHLAVCDAVRIVYDDLDTIAPVILAGAGGIKAMSEIGGPDRLAMATTVRVKKGDTIGKADGFDVLLEDKRRAPAPLDRPERYVTNAYAVASAISAPEKVLAALSTDASRIQCPLDYLPADVAAGWKEKLGDAWGMRTAKGDNACRTALADIPGAAQGAWFTDASHNGRTDKVSAIALAPDAVDPERLILALHGRVKSLTPEMVALAPMLDEERASAARDFLTFDKGDGRINPPFEDVNAGDLVCYQGLRANFVGPRIDAVILLGIEAADGAPPLLKIEARGVESCIDLEEPWAFSGAETAFYR